MKIETVDTEEGRIEYSETGAGKPVLFLHGGHSNCRETLFHKGFDTSKYRLITPSRPGYGKTPLNETTTPRKTADRVVSLLNHLGIDKVVVYGISAGGLTSLEIAANYPDRVEKLIMASAVSRKWLDKNGRVYRSAKLLFNPRSEKIVWGMIRMLSKTFPDMIAKSFYPQFTTNRLHKLKRDDVNELLSAFRHYSSQTGFMSDIDHDIADDVITRVTCPTLVIHSKNDNSVPFEHALHADKMIKKSELVGLDNEWGHLFWIGSDSEVAIGKTLEFLER